MMFEPTTHHESRMLQHVRAWRREAYETDRSLSADERARRLQDLQQRFDLPLRRSDRPSASAPTDDAT